MAFEQIEKTYTEKYGNTITLLSQQTKSKLESCVTVQGGLKGKAAVAADQIGRFQFAEVTDRLADTDLQDIDRERRWFQPKMMRGCVPLDSIDAIKTDLDPKCSLVVAGMAGINRAKDAAIMAAYYGTALTGENASASVSFDSNNVIAADYGSGDIIKQLNRAISKFAEHDVDVEAEQVWCVVNSVAAAKLREAGIYINSLYMDDKVLTKKTLTPYGPINFVQYEKVPSYSDSGTVYKLPVFCKSGVALGKWEEMKTRIGELPNKNYAWSVFMEFALGATRLEEAKCLSIEVK